MGGKRQEYIRQHALPKNFPSPARPFAAKVNKRRNWHGILHKAEQPLAERGADRLDTGLHVA